METLQRAANAGSVSTGFDIDNSAAFGGANGIQFNPSSDGNRKTWTVSLWVKRSEISVETTIFGATNTAMVFMDSDWFRFHLYTGSATYYYDTDNTGTVFRDTSAWYHLVFQCDTTQAVAANRTKLYINGALYTGARGGADTSANITQNMEFDINDNTQNFNLAYFYAGAEQLDGYLSEVNFTDGVANDADAFGEYDEDSGIWKPKAYEGSYGTNGFYLEFKESAGSATGIGLDTSGNGHNFSTGGAYPSQSTDTPTNNFATMSPLWKYATSSTLSNGGTYISTSTAGWTGAKSSIGVQNGKWYWEVKSTNVGWSLFPAGIQTANEAYTISGNAHSQNTTIALGTGSTYIKYVAGSESSVSTGGASMDTDNITGVALDLDSATKTLKWYRNNSLIGTVNIVTVSASFGNQLVFPFSSIYADSGTVFIEYNYGGYTTFSISSAASDANGYGTFEYAPPSGYYALCTKNLAEFG